MDAGGLQCIEHVDPNIGPPKGMMVAQDIDLDLRQGFQELDLRGTDVISTFDLTFANHFLGCVSERSDKP